MFINRLFIFASILLLANASIGMECTTEKIEEAKNTTVRTDFQVIEEDKFFRTWTKLQALVEARLEANEKMLALLESNLVAGIRALYDYPASVRDNQINFNLTGISLNFHTAPIINHISVLRILHGIKIEQLAIQKLDAALDWLLVTAFKAYCELEQQTDNESRWTQEYLRTNRDGAETINAISRKLQKISYQDNSKFYRYIIRKLSPFQSGFFKYFEIGYSIFKKNRDLGLAVNKMFERSKENSVTMLSG